MDKLNRLNKMLSESVAKPRISGLSIHFTPGGRAQASVTVSMGRSGMGYGNLVMGHDDERLVPIFNLIEEIINDEPSA